MKWYEPLYVGESVKKKWKTIKWKINHNAGVWKGFVITLANHESDLLEIYPARLLKQKGEWKKNLEIIGLAGTYEEALDMVQSLIGEIYHQTGTTDVKEYLKSNRGIKK